MIETPIHHHVTVTFDLDLSEEALAEFSTHAGPPEVETLEESVEALQAVLEEEIGTPEDWEPFTLSNFQVRVTADNIRAE